LKFEPVDFVVGGFFFLGGRRYSYAEASEYEKGGTPALKLRSMKKEVLLR
jgi:hypothetical protein